MGIELDQTPPPMCFLVSEAEDRRSRSQARSAAGVGFLVGTVLAAVLLAGSATFAFAADASNAGNGVLTPDATSPVLSGAKDGDYRVLFTAPTAFVVSDPGGKEIGKGVVGTAFAKQVKFTIAAGANAFAANDAFTLTVGIEAIKDERFVQLNFAGQDGSQIARGIAGYPVRAEAGVEKAFTLIDTDAQVRGSDLIWPAGATPAQIAEAAVQLRAQGIKIR